MSGACAGGSEGPCSRRSLKDAMDASQDRHKWALPMIRAADIEICRHADGRPIELGRGGFCKARRRAFPVSLYYPS